MRGRPDLDPAPVLAGLPAPLEGPYRWPGCDVQLFALPHHRVPRQRVRVLPADEDAEAPDIRLDGAKSGTVAVSPDQLLRPRRD